MKKALLSIFLISFVGFGQLTAQTYAVVSTYTGTTTAGLVNGTLATAEFDRPYALCTDPTTGTVYVADTYNHCIRKIAGGMVSTLAGNGTQGDVDAQGASARFFSPGGICFSNGYVYITDNGNHKIKKIDSNGNATTIAGTGSAGFTDGAVAQARFNNPFDIKANSAGDLFIADYYNHCIRKISGGTVTTIAGAGGVSGDVTGAAASARFNRPRSICFDGYGNLYIADMINNKIKMLTTGGIVNFVAGSGASGSQDGTGAGASFNYPLGVAMDMFGSVIVADGGGNKIRRCTTGGIVSTIAGNGTAGYVNGVVANAEFSTPAGLDLINGKIYIVDVFNNCVRYLDKADVSVPEIASALPLSIFPNPTPNTLFIDNPCLGNDHISQIQIFSLEGKLVKEINVMNVSYKIEIDVAELAIGNYVVVAISTDQKKYSSKFIKE